MRQAVLDRLAQNAAHMFNLKGIGTAGCNLAEICLPRPTNYLYSRHQPTLCTRSAGLSAHVTLSPLSIRGGGAGHPLKIKTGVLIEGHDDENSN